MKYIQTTILAGLLLILNGCAAFTPVALQIGEPEAQVIAKLGQPTARIPDENGYALEYSRNPWGQAIDMARFDRNGKLLSYQQVLTTENFATLKPGIATKEKVLRTVGHPSKTSYLSRQQLEVWDYPYKENGVWDSIMYIHFDNSGIVRKMENGPDPRFERDDGKFGFGGW